ncbi:MULTISPECIES: hypothetical protein [unclassified Streptomyces]|uniref:DUF7822 domain-containing protein n=1 Tax=unclassified Streptomyces TaxID=2593676 RepID=UPI0006AEC730|nr:MULTISPECIES: hypothetical protein [unclassified Streptomyces]KOX32460.1 hypothetical protein ADL06_10600 [Streptomyces sp. NRRL F-6491]KOX48453.1 hypothetical protein ADL08_10390 [Streptomyces sp. NRRL F-6492]
MANRSYLYSADSMPSEAELPRPIRCVSEHNWDIPLAHKLLVGRGTTIVPSMIWNPPIGIAADYAAGAALLLDLLRAVGEGLEDDAEFAECVARTTAHLQKQRAKHFVLETGEIVSMTDDDPAASVRSLVSGDIPEAVAEAEAALAGRNDAWLASVRADWQKHFASFYSDALYFSFPD